MFNNIALQAEVKKENFFVQTSVNETENYH